MSPPVSPPAGGMGFHPQPQSYGQPGQFPYGYTPYVSLSPFGGWQGMQGPCPQGPYFGPLHYAGPVPSAHRDRDDTASVSLSSVSESELEKEEEGSPHVVADDPTDDLKYSFEETPLTVVHAKVANLMNQALKETSVRNYQELLQKCCDFKFPANVKAQIPQLDHKVRQIVPAQVKHMDDSFIAIEKMILAILAPLSRACEASVSLQGLTQDQMLERLSVVRTATGAALSALCASTGEVARKRRLTIRECGKGSIDMSGIDFSSAAVH